MKTKITYMEHTFTPNELIRFIYRETSVEEEQRIKQAIIEQPEVADEFHRMMDSVALLDLVHCEPDETSVNIILNHSRSSIEEESHA